MVNGTPKKRTPPEWSAAAKAASLAGKKPASKRQRKGVKDGSN